MPSFKKTSIQQGRKSLPAGTTWGDPTITYVRTFQASAQPFTGDDDTINNQFTQRAREMVVVYDLSFDVKFEDYFYYRNSLYKVVYILVHDMGVMPHLEIFLADTQDGNTDWVV